MKIFQYCMVIKICYHKKDIIRNHNMHESLFNWDKNSMRASYSATIAIINSVTLI